MALPPCGTCAFREKVIGQSQATLRGPVLHAPLPIVPLKACLFDWFLYGFCLVAVWEFSINESD